MQVWFFSDLHLTDPESPLYVSFLSELDQIQPKDLVVLAGDIFDLFVGNHKKFIRKNQTFLKNMGELTAKGTPVYFIEGNHDFNLHSVLERKGVRVVPDEMVIDIPENRRKIYVAHGDLANPHDRNYLRFRSCVRSPWIKVLLNFLKVEWIEAIARKLSRPPQKQISDLPSEWDSQKRGELRKIYRDFANQKVTGLSPVSDFVILGHCHDLDEVPPFYWNMGYPPVHRQYLVYDSGTDQIKRVPFSRIP